jgi:outer membrane immunogenic protein
VKSILVGVAALAAAIGSPVLAADLALKAPPQPVAGPSWTGFYLGAGFGEGFYDADVAPVLSGAPVTATTNSAGKGWIAKLTAGYDYQFNSNIVGGVFANYDPGHIKGTLSNQGAFFFFDPIGGTMTESSDWAVGARLGYLFTPGTLGYVNGGYTQAHFDAVNLTDLRAGGFAGQLSANTYKGWFVGGGIETPVTLLPIPGLFFNTEYRYASYNTASFVDPTAPVFAENIRPTVQTITSGLLYKFNPGPSAKPAYSAPPPPPTSWTGFYVGVGAGYGFWDADTVPVNATTGAPQTGTLNNAGKGWLARFTGGFDYQVSNVVGGAFANFDAESLKGTLNTGVSVSTFDPLGGSEKETSDWAVGARLGYLVTPATLSYVDGGYTEARFDAINVGDLGIGTPIGQIAAHTYNGWFLGGGLETQVTLLPVRGLFFNTEYRYASYQSATTPIIAPGGGTAVINGTPVAMSIRPTVQTITSGLTYKFNWVQ